MADPYDMSDYLQGRRNPLLDQYWATPPATLGGDDVGRSNALMPYSEFDTPADLHKRRTANPPVGQHNLLQRLLSMPGQSLYDATVAGINNQETPYTGWNLFTEGPMGPFGMARAPARFTDPLRGYSQSQILRPSIAQPADFARLAEMGLDTSRPWYHGTATQFNEFAPGRRGVSFASDLDHARSGAFVDEQRRLMRGEPDVTQRLITAYVRPGRQGVVDLRREMGADINSPQVRAWQDAGYDSVLFRNTPEGLDELLMFPHALGNIHILGR
jgi:hypothetical protein